MLWHSKLKRTTHSILDPSGISDSKLRSELYLIDKRTAVKLGHQLLNWKTFQQVLTKNTRPAQFQLPPKFCNQTHLRTE